jgi:predicted MPP superfamily phosphohydrolase
MLYPPWLQPFATRAYRLVYLLMAPATASQSRDILGILLLAGASLLAPPIVHRATRALFNLTRVHPAESPHAISRRRFIGISGGAVAAAGAGVAAYATVWEPESLRVREYTIPVRDLPDDLHGMRCVHISDTHYGPYVTLPFLRSVIACANSLNPDFIILTGDYVHRTPRAIDAGIGVLAGLKSRFGAVAVLGNHDHWEGADACREAFNDIDLPLIDNTRVFLTRNGFRQHVDDGALCIGGVGDLWEDDVLLDVVLEGVPDGMPRFVLSHNPDFAEVMPAAFRVDLMLSGHTHGGQVWMPGMGTPVLPSGYGQKYAGGMCRGPRCPVLVSRGVGMAIIPVRFGVPPEIGLLTLVKAQQPN